MPIPTLPPNENFCAATLRFFDDASALVAAERWDGAVYLSGYVRECALKYLLSAHTPGLATLKDFGHDSARMHHPLLNLAASLTLREPRALSLSLRTGCVLDHQHPHRRYWPAVWDSDDADKALEMTQEIVRDLVIGTILDHGGALP